MFVLNLKILVAAVPEKSLTEKSLQSDTHTNIVTEKKKKTIYPLYFVCREYKIKGLNSPEMTDSMRN